MYTTKWKLCLFVCFIYFFYRKQSKTKKKTEIMLMVCAVECSEDGSDLYFKEIKHLHRCMVQHKRSSCLDQDSVALLHLKDKGHTFENCIVYTLDRK